MNKPRIGIYEKALPKNISWQQRLSLAKECGFDYVEMSIDETDERIARLQWNKKQRLEFVQNCIESGITVPSMCLSAHRRFPFGSHNPQIRQQAMQLMDEALKLAVDLGIRTIQLAGYDVYYEQHDAETEKLFLEGLAWATRQAAALQVMLAIETMDTSFLNAITKINTINSHINSPWLQIYPDIGNLSAWNLDLMAEFKGNMQHVVAIHLKDTIAVSEHSAGQFKNIAFGDGCVDFVSLFKLLKQLDYKGSFLIEMWSETAANPSAEIKHAKAWIENKMRLAKLID